MANLSGLLSHKGMIKRFIKKAAPKFKADLSLIIEDLFMQVADQTEENPFELVLILFRHENQAVGRVVNSKHEQLHEEDAGDMIKKMFFMQLEIMPAMLKDVILDKLEGTDINEMVVESLKDDRLIVHYGENEELKFVQVTKNEQKVIDFDEFISTFEF